LTEYYGHYDGTDWIARPSTFPIAVGAQYATGLWASDPSDYWSVYATGGDAGGGVLASVPADASVQGVFFFGIWGSSNSDIWIAGQGGILEHWNGSAWAVAQSPTTRDLKGVWGSASTDVWAVGAAGTILHYDGSTWSTQTSPTTRDLAGVAGYGADAWAVGATGTLLHLE
jgi:hypothetical protein